jgi:hypothetical protein
MPGGRRSFTTMDAQPWYDQGQRLRPPALIWDAKFLI